jgi:hypothetical protein
MPLASRRVLVLGLAAGLVAAGWAVAVHPPPGPRSARIFDPDRLAELEGEMWQAYYRHRRVALFRLLVVALREQFRYPWGKATLAAFHLARAAATFGARTSDYQAAVIPDLRRAYQIARDWTGAGFDPEEVARAELAWWVARRDPATSDPENVGRLIGVLYARFYQLPLDRVRDAGVLRARAAALRDRGGNGADWPEVRRLLRGSYRALNGALAGAP